MTNLKGGTPASVFAESVATMGVIKALIQSHPQPEVLAQHLAHQYQYALALMSAMPVPDEALPYLDAYWKALTTVDAGETATAPPGPPRG